jgi:GT2 family glycosyltransferase
MLVRKRDFDAVGGFDPDIFLYHEDDDLSRRLLRERGPLMFVSAAIVEHLEGRGSVRTPELAALKAYYLARSRVYALRKHGRPFPRLGSLLVAAAQLLAPTNWVSSRKRAKNVAFMQGVTSAFSDGGAHSLILSSLCKTRTRQ